MGRFSSRGKELSMGRKVKGKAHRTKNTDSEKQGAFM